MKIYGQYIEEVDNFWLINIEKPIYGTNVAINEKILEKAAEKNKYLVITCPGGEETTTPYKWKKKSKRIEKVFRFPDNPMVLYQGDVTTK